MSDLSQLIRKFPAKRVVVFGDLIADVFLYGEISRISREAPVLILNHRETQVVPGGGANAIHNLRTLGAHPVPVGIVGDEGADAEVQRIADVDVALDRVRVDATRRIDTEARDQLRISRGRQV